jgi:O-acetyl-ADP-ribose deacetylase (regulator of RNase III)
MLPTRRCSVVGAWTVRSTVPLVPNFSPNAARSVAARPAAPKSPWVIGCRPRHVIHAVGPVWQGGSQGEDEALASCYRRAIELCEGRRLASLAFPAISTGVYRFPADRAARIAVSATVAALQAAPSISQVVFCCFSGDSARLHAEALAKFGDPCAD